MASRPVYLLVAFYAAMAACMMKGRLHKCMEAGTCQDTIQGCKKNDVESSSPSAVVDNCNLHRYEGSSGPLLLKSCAGN